MCGIGGALPPLEKGRVGVGINRKKSDPHPARHSASKTRVNALMRAPTSRFQGEVHSLHRQMRLRCPSRAG